MTASSDLDLIVVYDFDEAHPESDGARPLHGRALFRAPHPAPDHRTHHADQRRTALRRRHAAAAVRPVRSGRNLARCVRRLPAQGGLDLGAHGAHPRARGVGVVAGARSRGRGGDPRGAVQPARRRQVRGRRRRDAPRDRGREGRRGPAGTSRTPPAASSTSSSSRNTSSSFTPRASRRSSTLRPVACSNGRRGSASSRSRTPRCCGRRSGSTRTSTQILRLCLAGPFEPKSAGGSLLSLLARAADVPDFATLEAHLAETQERVRKCFERILGSAP